MSVAIPLVGVPSVRPRSYHTSLSEDSRTGHPQGASLLNEEKEQMRTEETKMAEEDTPIAHQGSFLEVLRVFARLGISSFGGPVAHLGYFRQEIVVRRKWLDEAAYADLIGLCQFLPGPASSQVGISLGMTRAGLWGGLAAWLGFTLPSAIALTAFAYATTTFKGIVQSGWLHGLLIVAVAVVAQAVWGMAKTQCPDKQRATLALVAAIIILLWPIAIVQIGIIPLAGILGWLFLRGAQTVASSPLPLILPRRLAIGCLVLFFVLLLGLPILHQV